MTTSYFFLCSQNSKTYPFPQQITTFRKQKQSVKAFSSITKTTYLVHSLCFLLLQQIVCSYSHHSPTVSLVLWLSSSHFLKELIPFSVQQHQFFPQQVWHWHANLLLISSAAGSTFLYSDCSILLSLPYLIFCPQFTPVRIRFRLNCYRDYNCPGYQRSPPNQIQQSCRCLLFFPDLWVVFSTDPQLETAPSPAPHSDHQGPPWRWILSFFNCYVVTVSSGYCGRWT